MFPTKDQSHVRAHTSYPDTDSINRHTTAMQALARVTGTPPPVPVRQPLRRPWWAVAATAILVALGLGGTASAVQEEPIQTQARNGYVTAMVGLADAYQYATEVALSRGEFIACPVPGSEFVASFGAPRSGHTHQGTDMMAPDGTPIYAPEPGYYRQHGNDSFYLDGVSGAQWFGTHLQGHARGDGPVAAGELIAYVGHTGNASASAPHLHIEYHPGGEGSAAVEHYPTLAAACLGAPAVPTTRTANERPTFVYGVMEIHRWANETYGRISPTEARRLTAFLNTAVANRLQDYLDAVAAIPYEANWDRVAACESGGNWAINTGNGYTGGLQWLQSTFEAYGGTGPAWQQSKREQILVAERVRTTSGLHHWPTCGPLWYG